MRCSEVIHFAPVPLPLTKWQLSEGREKQNTRPRQSVVYGILLPIVGIVVTAKLQVGKLAGGSGFGGMLGLCLGGSVFRGAHQVL